MLLLFLEKVGALHLSNTQYNLYNMLASGYLIQSSSSQSWRKILFLSCGDKAKLSS